jgi:hypothetical protein
MRDELAAELELSWFNPEVTVTLTIPQYARGMRSTRAAAAPTNRRPARESVTPRSDGPGRDLVSLMHGVQRTSGNQAALSLLGARPSSPRHSVTAVVQRAIPPIGGAEKKALHAARADIFDAYYRAVSADITKITDGAAQTGFNDRLKLIKQSWDTALTQSSAVAKKDMLQRAVTGLTKLTTDLNTALATQRPATNKPKTEEEENKSKKELDEQRAATPVNNRNLDFAISIVDAKIARRVGATDAEALDSVSKMFGTRATDAKGVFPLVVARLWAIYKATDNKNQSGFIKDGSLGNMGALTIGSGANAKIHVSPKALAGQIEHSQLALDLLHEGTHAIDRPTADYAYKDGGGHYFLPPDLAYENAASYEQVGIDLIKGPSPGATQHAVQSKRALTEDRLDVALAMVRSRVTRTWVRTFEMRRQPKRAESVGVSAVVGAPPESDPLAISQHMFERQYDAIDMIHQYVLSSLQAKLSYDEAQDNAKMKGAVALVPEAVVNLQPPSQVGIDILRALLPRIEGKTGFTTAQLIDLIMHIENYDRPALRAKLQGYYAKFDTAVGITPAARQREQDEQRHEYQQKRSEAIELAGGEF